GDVVLSWPENLSFEQARGANLLTLKSIEGNFRTASGYSLDKRFWLAKPVNLVVQGFAGIYPTIKFTASDIRPIPEKPNEYEVHATMEIPGLLEATAKVHGRLEHRNGKSSLLLNGSSKLTDEEYDKLKDYLWVVK